MSEKFSGPFEGKAQEVSKVPRYKIDVSKGWDSVSTAEAFIEGLKKVGIYREGLLYSGFDGGKIGKTSGSEEAGIVYCSTEKVLSGYDAHGVDVPSALLFAEMYKTPAVGVYDPEKMVAADIDDAYRMKDASALLAICLLKM